MTVERPYDAGRLLSYHEMMETLPVVYVDPRHLEPSQDRLLVDRLLSVFYGAPPVGPDPAIHVVEHEGVSYVHNGHHRWICAVLAGRPTIAARVQQSRG